MALNKSASAREGRENQRYSPTTGARMVAGCIALNEQKDKIIMISSSVHKDKWVIPKGGIELDEDNFVDAAIRETWEEAGVEGRVVKKLDVIFDMRPPKTFNSKGIKVKVPTPGANGEMIIPKSEFHFYEMIVSELSKTWPESHKRERRWCTYSEAKHELEKSNRPELLEALNRSSIIKSSGSNNY